MTTGDNGAPFLAAFPAGVDVVSPEALDHAARSRLADPDTTAREVGAAAAEGDLDLAAAAVPGRAGLVDGLGAGDAFGGALAAGLALGLPLRRTLEIANAAGALVAGRHAYADAMLTLARSTT